jgi:hypothetical protein
VSADQDHRIRQILAQLEVTSNGTIYSYSVIGSKGAFESGAPTTGDSQPPHVYWAAEYNRCASDFERGKVIGKATTALEELTHRLAPRIEGEAVEQRNRRIIRDYAGWTAQEVATHFRCGVREVWRVRDEDGRDKDYGKPREAASKTARLAAEERRRRVVELKQAHPGMTARQIAMHVGADHKTVQADLKRAA